MKTNGMLAALILYMVVFGIKVDTGQSATATHCKPIAAPLMEPTPAIPLIGKEHINDKTYVVRVLVNHINLLNKQIAARDKQTSDIYNTYTKCVVP